MPCSHPTQGGQAQEGIPGDAKGSLKTRRPTFLGLSGTPGTGKKTLAPIIAKELGIPSLAINSLVKRGGDEAVDPKELRKPLLEKTPSGAIVYGHLLPHVLRKGEVRFVGVLRCEPKVLAKRLEKRAYPKAKITENVEAELIGVVHDECVRRFGGKVVHEYDTTSVTPAKVAEAIVHDIESKAKAKPDWIDWTLGYDSSRRLWSLFEGASAPPAST